MHPVLFEFGGLTIHTYGFFIALAVLAGLLIAKYEAKRVGLDPDKVVDAGFYVVLAAIVGSRVLYVLTNLDVFISAPLDVFKIWNGGLVFYGGFIAAAIVLIVYLKIHHLPLGKMADISAISLPLGHTLGRIGCLFAGCCYGKVCHQPWAITFRDPASLAPVFVPLHPTQLYSAMSNFLIFVLVFALRRFKQYDGQLFWIYIACYGTNRSLIEVFRGDFRGDTLFQVLSISQAIGLSSAFIAIMMLIILGRKHSVSQKNARN